MELTPEALLIICRFIHFTAVMLLAGCGLFSVLLSGDRVALLLRVRLRYTARCAAVLTALTTVLWLLLQAALMGDGWADMQDPDIIFAVLSTSFGEIWRWQLVLAVVLCSGLLLPAGRAQSSLFLVCAAVMLALHAFTGHGMLYSGWAGRLYQLNQVVHLLSAAYWFGGLWPFLVCLLILLRRDSLAAGLPKDVTATLIRFSNLGHLAVFLVLATGLISTLMLLPDWPQWSGSDYQALLWLKTGLVLTMVLLAVINRYAVVPKIAQSGRFRLLMINSWIEIILGTLAILMVAIFATYQPA
ncbi:copper homeostasis membrane protein CopD [Morganella morganii]|uniref:copper homeostasis membrane protein CopD n=1 Tax=Morganella morganii TaxID=582 RepID=UPI0015F4F62B|nr:copper homeostasis membrane protein CopD [Morganella morganii]MBA5809524.1 copper homeostasis membrane protein CopD [Morganella morganii]